MIELKLELNDVNVILAALGKMPLEQVVDVFHKIKAQAQPQVQEVKEDVAA